MCSAVDMQSCEHVWWCEKEIWNDQASNIYGTATDLKKWDSLFCGENRSLIPRTSKGRMRMDERWRKPLGQSLLLHRYTYIIHKNDLFSHFKLCKIHWCCNPFNSTVMFAQANELHVVTVQFLASMVCSYYEHFQR